MWHALKLPDPVQIAKELEEGALFLLHVLCREVLTVSSTFYRRYEDDIDHCFGTSTTDRQEERQRQERVRKQTHQASKYPSQRIGYRLVERLCQARYSRYRFEWWEQEEVAFRALSLWLDAQIVSKHAILSIYQVWSCCTIQTVTVSQSIVLSFS